MLLLALNPWGGAATRAFFEDGHSELVDAPGEMPLADVDVSATLERLAVDCDAAFTAARAAIERTIGEARAAQGEKDLVASGGRWRSSRFDPEDHPWQVELERDRRDGAIEGRVRVVGSRLLVDATRLRGRIDAGRVSGAIWADDGRALASFTGTVGKEGMHGTWESADGDSGEWSWGAGFE